MKKLFENVGDNQFKLSKENRYARHNPDAPHGFEGDIPGSWTDLRQAEELRKKLLDSVDAGNFDMAHKIVDELFSLHN